MLRYFTPFLLLVICGCSGYADVSIQPSSRFGTFFAPTILRLDREGKQLVAVGGNGLITLWDTQSQEVSWERRFREGMPTDVAFADDGQRLFAAWDCRDQNSLQCKVRIMDAREGDVSARYCLGSGERIAAISPAGGVGYVVCDDSGGFVDLYSRRRVATNLRPAKHPYCTFSLDGKTAALWGTGDDILFVCLGDEHVSSIHVPDAKVVAVTDDTVFVRDADGDIWSYSATGESKGRRVAQRVMAFTPIAASRQYACLDHDGRLCVGSLDGELAKELARVYGQMWYYHWKMEASPSGLLAIAGSTSTTYPIASPYLGCVQLPGFGSEAPSAVGTRR